MSKSGVRGKGVLAALALAAGLVAPSCKGGEQSVRPSQPQVTRPDPGRDAGEAARPGKPLSRPAVDVPEVAALERRRRGDLQSLGFESAHETKLCLAAKPVNVGALDVHRSLFVHDRATLDALGPKTFSLRRTLEKIASDAVAAGAPGATAEGLFRDLWDTQNRAENAATKDGAHCDDDGTTLNGFPNACRPVDGAQAKAELGAEIADYRAIGLVNRFDLAAEGWKNCGEHRIVYGRQGESFQRSFIIFEAVLPNPRPGCQSGCRAVAEHWASLSSVASPKERAQRLEQLFYKGLPGFRPVVHVDHYAATGASSRYGSSGSGQIRTNQFLEQPWMMKELKLALDCTSKPCQLDPVPIPVKVNPDGHLWTESVEGLASAFQQKVVLPQAEQLGIEDLNLFSYQVPAQFDAARSESQTGGLADHYPEAYVATGGEPNGFRVRLAEQAASLSPRLTDKQLVNRAMALSCAGCHQPGRFGLLAENSMGPGQRWPDSAAFVHVRAETDETNVHRLSPALLTRFLPFRAKVLAEYLGEKSCLCRFKQPGFDVATLEKRAAPRPPRTLKDLRDAEERIKGELDRARVAKGEGALPELAPELAAQPLVLEEVRAAGGDAKARAVARRRAVQKLVSEEPPRKTVTGHFRSH